MARGHGRILTSIWDDADFLMLDQERQRLYLFLISQPNLNHAGLLPLTLRRWARKSAGLSPDELEKHLAALDEARFIVVDDDTEELLIRSFVRNDGVWKQPKVMGAMVSGAMEISSRKLRRALVEEMDRIPVDELSDEPTKLRTGDGPSIRQQVVEHIEGLRRAFREFPPTPPAGVSEGASGTPCASPSETPFDTPVEGGREASTRGHTGAQTRAAPAPAPSPVPYPSPRTEGADVGVTTTTALVLVQSPRQDGLSPIDDDGFEVTDGMRRWAVRDGYTALIDIDHATAQFVSHYRSTGASRKSWPDAWQKWIRDDHKRAVERNNRPAPGSRQQREVDEQYERQMARAEARMQQESS